MLEARFLAGNTELATEFREQFRSKCVVGHERDYVQLRMPEFVQKKQGTAAPGWAFDLKRDRAAPEKLARSIRLRNFVPRGRNRRRKPTPRGVSQESRVLLANSPKEKIARSPRSR